jgi:hypothetical protein
MEDKTNVHELYNEFLASREAVTQLYGAEKENNTPKYRNAVIQNKNAERRYQAALAERGESVL